ncbi:hypothetical protein C0585_08415 [Candidatus Woesearchaeota archaeon]|nr:MAG: hypothetical protein C0585_08415 [Candidatus Woesearchaeota archaeon]
MNIFKDSEAFLKASEMYPEGVEIYGKMYELIEEKLIDLGLTQDYLDRRFDMDEIVYFSSKFQEAHSSFVNDFPDVKGLDLDEKIKLMDSDDNSLLLTPLNCMLFEQFDHYSRKISYENLDWGGIPIKRKELQASNPFPSLEEFKANPDEVLWHMSDYIKYNLMDWDQEVIPRNKAIFYEQIKDWDTDRLREAVFAYREGYLSSRKAFKSIGVEISSTFDNLRQETREIIDSYVVILKNKSSGKDNQEIKGDAVEFSSLTEDPKKDISKIINSIRIGRKFQEVKNSLLFGPLMAYFGSATWNEASQMGDLESTARYVAGVGFVLAAYNVVKGFMGLRGIHDVFKDYMLKKEDYKDGA